MTELFIIYIHFQVLPMGLFSNLLKVRWLRVLARLLQVVHNVFFCLRHYSKLCPQLTGHNTGISLLLSTNVGFF